MKILAGEFVRLDGRSVFVFPSAAHVKKNSLIVQPSTTANECGMTAEYDQIAVSALSYLFEAYTVAFAARRWGIVWVKAVPQHFLCQNMNTLQALERDS